MEVYWDLFLLNLTGYEVLIQARGATYCLRHQLGKYFSPIRSLLKPAHLLLLTKVWSTPGLTFGKIRNGPTAIAFVGGGFAITIFSLLERTVLSKTVLKY